MENNQNENTSNQENNDWVDVRREYEIDANGNEILKKVAKERSKIHEPYTRKEKTELRFKILSSLAIFVPIFLFTLNTCVNDKNEAEKYKLEVYGNMKICMRIMQNKPIKSKEYLEAKEELYFKIYPKLGFINDDKVTSLVGNYIDIFNGLELLDECQSADDSVDFLCLDIWQYTSMYIDEDSIIRPLNKILVDSVFHYKNEKALSKKYIWLQVNLLYIIKIIKTNNCYSYLFSDYINFFNKSLMPEYKNRLGDYSSLIMKIRHNRGDIPESEIKNYNSIVLRISNWIDYQNSADIYKETRQKFLAKIDSINTQIEVLTKRNN